MVVMSKDGMEKEASSQKTSASLACFTLEWGCRAAYTWSSFVLALLGLDTAGDQPIALEACLQFSQSLPPSLVALFALELNAEAGSLEAQADLELLTLIFSSIYIVLIEANL